jgi:hypothetical protein
MEVFASALDVAADAVVAQKMVVIGAAVALAGEVIAIQGEALFTFGLAEAEVPAEVAATRLIVRGALQELEGQLLGALITKAAAIAGDALGGAVGKLVTGGGQVVSEAVVLKADYNALETLASVWPLADSRLSRPPMPAGAARPAARWKPVAPAGAGAKWPAPSNRPYSASFRPRSKTSAVPCTQSSRTPSSSSAKPSPTSAAPTPTSPLPPGAMLHETTR